jgi:hypothetical protein
MTYVNHGSVTAVGILFPVLATMGLMLRVYGLQRQKQRMQPDDILLVASYVSVIPPQNDSLAGFGASPLTNADQQMVLVALGVSMAVGKANICNLTCL